MQKRIKRAEEFKCTTIYLNAGLKRKIKYLAIDRGTTMSDLMNRAAAKYLEGEGVNKQWNS